MSRFPFPWPTSTPTQTLLTPNTSPKNIVPNHLPPLPLSSTLASSQALHLLFPSPSPAELKRENEPLYARLGCNAGRGCGIEQCVLWGKLHIRRLGLERVVDGRFRVIDGLLICVYICMSLPVFLFLFVSPPNGIPSRSKICRT